MFSSSSSRSEAELGTLAPRAWASRQGLCVALAALIAAVSGACSNKPTEAPPPASAALTAPSAAEAPRQGASGPDGAVEGLAAAPSPSEAPSTASAASPSGSEAAEASAPIDWKNETPYVTESDELTQRARGLFEAIVKLEPELAEDFWFPKEPFIPLKDVKDPGRYWDNLHRAYLDDVRALHRTRKSWDGAVFERFTLGSSPKWVKPGDEVNKIGYYRSFRGVIHYRIDDKPAKLDVRTLITWQGRWYVTHLRKLKKK